MVRIRGPGIRTRFRSVDSTQLCLPGPPVPIARMPLSRPGAAHHPGPPPSRTLIPARQVWMAGSRHSTGEPLRCQLRADALRSVPGAGPVVGSGVVEAGCITDVRNRSIRSGMQWTVDGAQALLAVCCSVIGTRTAGNAIRQPPERILPQIRRTHPRRVQTPHQVLASPHPIHCGRFGTLASHGQR